MHTLKSLVDEAQTLAQGGPTRVIPIQPVPAHSAAEQEMARVM